MTKTEDKEHVESFQSFEFDRTNTRNLDFTDIPTIPMYVSALLFLAGLGVMLSAVM